MIRPNILILIQSMSQMGGTEIVALNTLNAFCELGIEAKILSVEPYTGWEPKVNSVSFDDREHYGLKEPLTFEKLIGSSRYSNALRRYLTEYCLQHNVTTLLNFTYENLKSLPTLNKRIKTIGIYHWSVEGYEKSLKNIAAQKSLLPRVLSKIILHKQAKRLHKLIAKTDYAIALTHSGAEELKRLSPKANVAVIPNFLPYTSGPESINLRHGHRVIYVGRLSPEKGVFNLLDIWDNVVGVLPDATLKIYGNGQSRGEMEKIIAERNIPGIEFMGFVANQEKIYSNADLLMCTSYTEGFGMILIEAMHHGVIPVAFDCPVSPRELIGDGGETAKCFDNLEFAEKAIKILTDEEKFTCLQRNGIVRASQFYKHTVMKQWLQIIK